MNKLLIYNIYELICRACGKSINRRLTQFDSLPDCPNCGSEMLAANVTSDDVTTADNPQQGDDPQKENDNE